MMTRFYDFTNAMQEVKRILCGSPEKVAYNGKSETYSRGSKSVTVEKMFFFDDENGNVYDVKGES